MVERLCAGWILGMDFIRKHNLIIDMKKQVVWIGDRMVQLRPPLNQDRVNYQRGERLTNSARVIQRRIPPVSLPNRSPPAVVVGAVTDSHSSVQRSSTPESQTAYQACD